MKIERTVLLNKYTTFKRVIVGATFQSNFNGESYLYPKLKHGFSGSECLDVYSEDVQFNAVNLCNNTLVYFTPNTEVIVRNVRVCLEEEAE